MRFTAPMSIDEKNPAPFAVLETGGKQYRVELGGVIRVERLAGEAGDIVNLESVLMLGEEGSPSLFGRPYLEGALVRAEILSQERDKKIRVFKKKRRNNYRRLMGHRQRVSVLRITDIPKIAALAKEGAKTKKAPKETKEKKEAKEAKEAGDGA